VSVETGSGEGYKMPRLKWAVFVVITVLRGGIACTGARAQETDPGIEHLARSFIDAHIEQSVQSMNRPFEPFRVIGNIHYVGASDVSSFLSIEVAP
jgi:hypothetical protein